MHVMQVRVAAAQAAIARFEGRPLRWSREDCVRLGAFITRKLGRPVSLAKAGSYSSQRGAVKALKRAGYDTLEAAVDGQGLMQIPPAAALPGDLLGLEADWPGGKVALFVCLGNGRALGFHPDAEGRPRCQIVQPTKVLLAWRVEPCLRR